MRIEMESNNSNVSEAVIPADYQVLNKKLSKKTLIAYGCGDFASNLCWTFIGSYLRRRRSDSCNRFNNSAGRENLGRV